MTRKLIYALLPVLYLLHNALWLWDDATLIAGRPVGLVDRLGVCFAGSITIYLLVTRAWPKHLEVLDDDTPETERS